MKSPEHNQDSLPLEDSQPEFPQPIENSEPWRDQIHKIQHLTEAFQQLEISSKTTRKLNKLQDTVVNQLKSQKSTQAAAAAALFLSACNIVENPSRLFTSTEARGSSVERIDSAETPESIPPITHLESYVIPDTNQLVVEANIVQFGDKDLILTSTQAFPERDPQVPIYEVSPSPTQINRFQDTLPDALGVHIPNKTLATGSPEIAIIGDISELQILAPSEEMLINLTDQTERIFTGMSQDFSGTINLEHQTLRTEYSDLPIGTLGSVPLEGERSIIAMIQGEYDAETNSYPISILTEEIITDSQEIFMDGLTIHPTEKELPNAILALSLTIRRREGGNDPAIMVYERLAPHTEREIQPVDTYHEDGVGNLKNIGKQLVHHSYRKPKHDNSGLRSSAQGMYQGIDQWAVQSVRDGAIPADNLVLVPAKQLPHFSHNAIKSYDELQSRTIHGQDYIQTIPWNEKEQVNAFTNEVMKVFETHSLEELNDHLSQTPKSILRLKNVWVSLNDESVTDFQKYLQSLNQVRPVQEADDN